MKNLIVKSPAFKNNQKIPSFYTCDGSSVNPPLIIEGTPVEAKSLVLIMDDPDAPMGTFDHWVVYNIPAKTSSIKEHSSPPGTEGLNSARRVGYTPPCPPSGTHRYFFKVYALDNQLDLKSNSRKKDVENAMESHVLAKGELIGLFR